MTDTSVSAPGQPTAQTAGLASGGAGSRRLRGARNYLALIPFHAYIALFLILPTPIVAVGAFTTATGQPTSTTSRGCSRTRRSSTRSPSRSSSP